MWLLTTLACTWIGDAELAARLAGNDHDQDGDGHDAIEQGGDDCWDDPTTVPAAFVTLAGTLQPDAADVHPGAVEIWYDGADEDCGGEDDFDQDGDGYASAAYPQADGSVGDDCFDADDDPFDDAGGVGPADVHPDAAETWYDGTDQDCAGDDDFDQDHDGAARDADCDDTDPLRYPDPTIPEVWYDGVDDDCDGNDGDQDGDGYYAAGYPFTIPEAYRSGDCWDAPADGDAWTPLNGLAAPSSADVHPDAADPAYDGLDEDCAGDDDFDQDGDGHATDAWIDATGGFPGDDCDDADATVNPDATETWYDGVDADCAGDDDFDADADGHTSNAYAGDDCDDADADVNPDESEVCGNPVDENCSTDDEGAVGCTDFYADADHDGYGAADAMCLCDATGDHTATDADDCDDTDAAVNPAATESCATAADDDCDGATDAVGALGCTDFYADVDGDGYGAIASRCTCAAMGTYAAATADDCDDGDAGVHPSAPETCDGDDEDCDGTADDGLPLSYADADGDGYGSGTGDCSAPAGWVSADGDCDDTDARVLPGGIEYCDGVANDCDTLSTWTSADEDQLVSFETTAGAWSDVSSSFAASTATTTVLASSGTYRFCAGTYYARLSATGASVGVVGLYGAAVTTIDNNASTGSTLAITGGSCTVSGLTLSGGHGSGATGSTYGGVVLANATAAPSAPTLTLTDVVITGGAAAYGGGVAVYGSSWVVLDGTTVEDNVASGNGGGVYVSATGTLELVDATLSTNTTPGNGGGIYILGAGVVTLDGSVVSDNTTTGTGDGGGVWVGSGSLDLVDSVIRGNSAADDGGGVYLDYGSVSCTATTGGGIYANTATDAGGGAYLYQLSAGTLTSDACDWGTGALDNSATDVDIRTSITSHAIYAAYASGASFTCSGATGVCAP